MTKKPMNGPNGDVFLHYEVGQFLVDEAALLDEHRLYEWLDLFTDDARYWVPVTETVEGEMPSTASPGSGVMTLFDDDKDFLIKRVKRLDTGLAHAEQPRSRTRHLITNLRLVDVEESGESVEVTALANFIVFQSRLEQSDHFFVGRREDRLRKTGDGWRIARRHVWLDQELLPRAVSTFF